MDFNDLLAEAQQLEMNGQLNKAWDIYIQILSLAKRQDHHGEGYFEFGLFLFRNQQYDEALQMLIKAYEKNYNSQNVLNFIEEAYCEPNMEDFKACYEKNIAVMNMIDSKSTSISFESLSLRFIPYSDKKFHIFDIINNKFSGCFVLNDIFDNNENMQNINERHIVKNEYNPYLVNNYARIAKENCTLLYLIYDDYNIFLSYMQIADFSAVFKNPDIKIFFTSVDFVNHFYSGVEVLPKVVINGSQDDDYVKFIKDMEMLKEENIVKPTYIPTEKALLHFGDGWKKGAGEVVLSFCIPTYNRGHRAIESVKHILNLEYQKEIEVIVCDNDSLDINGQYKKLGLIEDTRLRYYKNEENIGFLRNIMRTIQYARGKYVYIISDEDYVNLESVPKLLNLLRREKELAVVKGSMKPATADTIGGNSFQFPDDFMLKKGLDAVKMYAFHNTYISGTIYNRDFIVDSKLYELLLNNQVEHVAYPHIYLEALLCTKGNIRLLSDIICLEGKSEDLNLDSARFSQGPYSYESRLRQHAAFSKTINELFHMMESNNLVEKANLYLTICEKTFYLIALVNGKYYEEAGSNILLLVNNTYYFCLKIVAEMFSEMDINLKMLLSQKIKIIYENYIRKIAPQNINA